MKKQLLKKILGRGVSGVRLREASEPDMLAIRDLIVGALRTLLKLGGEDDPWPYVLALYDSTVVIDLDGKLLSYGYTVAGQDVAFGEPVEVAREFTPVADTSAPAAPDAPVALVEAVSGSTNTYLVRVIRAGLSKNKNFYPDTALREAVDMFNNVRVFVKSDQEHLRDGGKDFRNIVGALSAAKFTEGATPDTGEITAKLTLIVGEDDPVATRLREATSRGLSHLFGLSIDADGRARKGTAGLKILEAFTKINSVDLIVDPGAGGEVLSFLEAAADDEKGNVIMDRDELIALITANAPHLLEGKDLAALTDEELKALLAKALEKSDEATDGETATTLVEAVERRTRMREAVNASRLPTRAKDRLVARFTIAAKFTEAEVRQAIKDEADYIGGGAHVMDLGDGGGRFIEAGEGPPEKIEAMLDAFFDPKHKDHKHARSFKECYVQITGDRRVTGRVTEAVHLREALASTSFAEILGDGIHRRMVAEYRSANDLDFWRLLTGPSVPINDFRQNQRTRMGGYGDIPAVAESADYVALTSPTDEQAEYAVSKRGGLESVTLEMIKNDDVGAIARIPNRLARAAKRTLCKFVMDFIKNNAAIYDTKALFHVDHGNLGSAALSAATYAAARLAMVTQTEYGSTDPLGVGPSNLWISPAQEETAYNLFQRATNNDKTFVQSLVPTIIPVPFWTDANDWAATANVADIPFIEIGFLDGNEEPELFVQDSPTVGSLFSADKVTYKLRHIYGGAVEDYRGAYKAVVA
tara:strand:- start:19402 stop:21672 length:2271 start_codon:yes stop_codon:yes gene_type:complete